MLEMIEKRITCYCGGTSFTKPVFSDTGKNLAVTLLPPDSILRSATVVAIDNFKGPLAATPNTVMEGDFWFNTTTDRWAYAIDTTPSNAVDVNNATKFAAMNALIGRIDFAVLGTESNLGVWASANAVKDALDDGIVILTSDDTMFATTNDNTHQAFSYAPLVNDELPGGIHPVVAKTDDTNQVVFGKLISITPDGTECTVAVKGRNIVFAANGANDNPIGTSVFGRGILSTSTIGKVTFATVAGNRMAKDVGYIVGGTNQNYRVEIT